MLASKLSTNAEFQNLQDLNSRTFQGFPSTFKHLICFQALSRALKFSFQIQAFSRISQARYEPCLCKSAPMHGRHSARRVVGRRCRAGGNRQRKETATDAVACSMLYRREQVAVTHDQPTIYTAQCIACSRPLHSTSSDACNRQTDRQTVAHTQ